MDVEWNLKQQKKNPKLTDCLLAAANIIKHNNGMQIRFNSEISNYYGYTIYIHMIDVTLTK